MPDARPDAILPGSALRGSVLPCATDDERWMRRALELAELGCGRVEPNPMVGCVVVSGDREISIGWHEQFGGPHAEVNALKGVPPEEVRHADVFVTLEPCSHHGKTPPCLDLLLKLRPRRVVVAMLDPFPQVAGRGVAGLRSAGIQVDVGILEREAQDLNAPYLKRNRTELPWVIAKWAATLDGAIATAGGDSQWITSSEARHRAHILRSRVDAILIGSETALRDNPLLTARLPPPAEIPRVATRVVVDRRLRVSADSQLVQTADSIPLCIVTTQGAIEAESDKAERMKQLGAELLVLPADEKMGEMRWLLNQLCRRGVTNVMAEGGGKLLGSLFDGNFVDQIDCFIATRILGSEHATRPISGQMRRWIAESQTLVRVRVEMCGTDIHVRGYWKPTGA